MKILLLCHSFNSLTQKIFVMLRERGEQVSVQFDINDQLTAQAVDSFQPDLIVAPFLKRAIAMPIWQQYRCLIVHPGVVGDRGPAALDRAIMRAESRWGVTVLQANEIWDGGDVYSTVAFSMPTNVRKGPLYRSLVAEAAVEALTEALLKIEQNESAIPQRLLAEQGLLKGQWHDPVSDQQRTIDWSEMSSAQIMTLINSADGQPGALATIENQQYRIFDAHSESQLSAMPGIVLGCSDDAVCIGTADGAIWLGQLALPVADQHRSRRKPLKLPAVRLLQQQGVSLEPIHSSHNYQEIWVEIKHRTAFVYFEFYNGAMDTGRCQRLQKVLEQVAASDVQSVVLMGGADFWSNGLHLNCIEAADSPANESWLNINAMNDLCKTIIEMDNKFVVAMMRGNAGAGGVFMALAADRVLAYESVILNPHYKAMGNLYGSEYWTYLLPKRVGEQHAQRLMSQRLPMSARQAKAAGLIDGLIKPTSSTSLTEQLVDYLANINLQQAITEKLTQRQRDELAKPLRQYREEELQQMKLNFFGFDSSYHVARYHFVNKTAKSRTPHYLIEVSDEGLTFRNDGLTMRGDASG